MELELCKETYSCYEALPPLVETREQSTETIVPDYCPDIARIVEGSGCLFVRSREIADGRVSVSGSLRVTLLYIADGSGGLKSFSYTLPVEETLDGRLREGCTEASVSGCVSALEVRALNPRKIMTRAAVELTVTPYCAAQLTACGDVTQRAENGIETLCETQEVSIIKALRSKDFVFSDDLVLSSSKEPAAELLRESASVRTTECRLIGGKIILKGVVCVEVLYLSESGTICSAAAELPFSQIVEGVEDADENTSAEAMLCLTGAELRIGGESGDARTISAKLFLHAFVVLRQRLCLRCITDLYSTSCDLSAQMQTLELCGGVETVTQEQNVREQIETGVEVSAVLCAEVHFGSVSLVQEESTANVRCTAILRVLYLAHCCSGGLYRRGPQRDGLRGQRRRDSGRHRGALPGALYPRMYPPLPLRLPVRAQGGAAAGERRQAADARTARHGRAGTALGSRQGLPHAGCRDPHRQRAFRRG